MFNVCQFQVLKNANFKKLLYVTWCKVAGQVLRNNSRLRQYLSCFQKETKSQEKKFCFFYPKTDMLFFFLFKI